MWQPVDSSSAHSSKALPKEPSNLEDSQNKLGATSSSTETDHTNPATTEESNSRAAILSSPRRSEGQKQRGTVVQSHKRTDDEQLNSSSADASTSPLLTRVKSPSNVAWSAVLPPSKRDTTDATLEEIPTNTNVVYNVERDTARDNLDHSTNNPNPTSIAPSSDNDPNNHEFIMSTSEEIPTTDTHSTGVFHHNMQWPQRRLFTLEEERSKDLSSVCLDPAGEQDNHNTAIEQSVTAKPIDDHLPSLPSNIEMDRYLSKSEANSSIDSHHSAPVEASASVIIEEAITNQADLHDHTNEQLARTPVLDALPKDQTAEDDVLTENKQHLDPHTPLRQDNHRKVSYVSSPLLHWDASPLHEASGSALTKLPGQHAPPSQNALAHYQMADTDDSVAEATNIRDQMTSTADIELTNNNSTISQLPTVENDMTIEVSEELEHRIDTSINLPINGMINRQDPISVNARNLPQESIAFLSSAIPMNDTYIPAISLPNRPNTANLTSSASAPHTPTRRPLSTPAWQPVSARPAGVSDKKVLFNDEFDDDKRERTNRSTKEEQEQEDKDKDKEGTDHYDDMIVRKHHTVDPFTRVNDDQHSNNTNNDNNNTIKSKAVKAASAHGTPATSPRKQQEGVPMNGDLRLSMLSDSAEVMGKAPDRKQHLAQLSRRANMLKMRQSTSSVPGLSNNAESSTSALASKSVNNYEAKPLFAPMKSSDIRKKLEFASNTMTINPITTETINYVPMLDEFSPRSMAASTHFAGEVVVDTTSNTTAPLWPLEQSGQQQQQQQQQQQALDNDWHGMASIAMEMNQHHNNQSEAIHLLHNSTTYENTTSNSIEQDIYERQRQHMTAILAEKLPSNQWELLNTIDLSDIPTLQSFNGLDRLCPLLEELVARRCSLTSLSGCPSRVQRLNVMGNQLNEAEITKLHHLSELTILELSDNHLRKLINFGELKQLRDLRVDRNKISEFEDLSGTRLEHLSLRGNQLVEIDCSRLPCAYMKNLLLNKNSITKVHAIGLLQQLQVLNLEHNMLSLFESSAPLANLHTLRLSHNQLYQLHVGKFPALRVLYADCNILRRMDGLADLPVLDSFSLRDQQRNWEMNFDALPPARNLYLSGNPFPDLARCARARPELEFLELSGCSVVGLPHASLWPNIRVLNLNYNHLRDLSPLHRLLYLRRLMLVANSIETIDMVACTVRRLPKLHALDLRRNPVANALYAPLISTTATVLCLSLLPYQVDMQWRQTDLHYRMHLSDLTMCRRAAYRSTVIRCAPACLSELDGQPVASNERNEAEEMFRWIRDQAALPDVSASILSVAPSIMQENTVAGVEEMELPPLPTANSLQLQQQQQQQPHPTNPPAPPTKDIASSIDPHTAGTVASSVRGPRTVSLADFALGNTNNNSV